MSDSSNASKQKYTSDISFNPLKDKIVTPIIKTKSNFAVLKIFVNTEDEELVRLYKEHIDKHNESIQIEPYPNSGFDIFITEDVVFDEQFKTKMINTHVKAEMIFFDCTHNTIEPTGYMLYPRSSISKTPLMLANHTGIIDSGYRGWLIGAFRSFESSYKVEKYTRLLQICHPTLCPIYVHIISECQLTDTTRDEGGFGSTGIVGV